VTSAGGNEEQARVVVAIVCAGIAGVLMQLLAPPPAA
jgi:hypothetical protein